MEKEKAKTKGKIKAGIKLDGKNYVIYISPERARQIKRLQQMLKESSAINEN